MTFRVAEDSRREKKGKEEAENENDRRAPATLRKRFNSGIASDTTRCTRDAVAVDGE